MYVSPGHSLTWDAEGGAALLFGGADDAGHRSDVGLKQCPGTVGPARASCRLFVAGWGAATGPPALLPGWWTLRALLPGLGGLWWTLRAWRHTCAVLHCVSCSSEQYVSWSSSLQAMTCTRCTSPWAAMEYLPRQRRGSGATRCARARRRPRARCMLRHSSGACCSSTAAAAGRTPQRRSSLE